ncbi:hypothetical protein KAH37_10485 [bacterium]|nr:hypothetical protein [bacterium]
MTLLDSSPARLIKRLVVDPRFKDHPLPKKVAKQLGITPIFLTKDELIEETLTQEDDIFVTAKQTLFFTENSGQFLKRCPGSRHSLCCNYMTINSVTGCPFDCSYCILQHYIANNPFISVFLNRYRAIEEMKEALKTAPFLRVGTGELADSLALDELLGESEFFLSNIAKDAELSQKVQFEFKTKSVEIEPLLNAIKRYPHLHIVAGFSVNLPHIQKSDELYTAPIETRVEAMNRIINAGAKIAIHFDPVIMFPDYLEQYETLAKQLFSSVDIEKVAWISMGGFRYSHEMEVTFRKRWPDSLLPTGEMFIGDDDGKERYLATVRASFYSRLKATISSFYGDKNPPLYICMDKTFLWNRCDMTPPKAGHPHTNPFPLYS